MPRTLIVNINANKQKSGGGVKSSIINGFEVTIDGSILRFKPVNPLPNNTEVGIKIRSGFRAADGSSLSLNLDFWYTTIYYPVFVTATMIRLSEGLGPFLADISDDTIWRTILKNTLCAFTIWKEGKSRLNINNGVPWCAFSFVMYATILDLMNYLIISSAQGGGSKTLADLSIKDSDTGGAVRVMQNIREHVVGYVKYYRYLVTIGCSLQYRTGVRSDQYWEPQPIIDHEVTWKRYPSVEHIHPSFVSMYPHSYVNRNLEDIEQAWDRGKLLSSKFYSDSVIVESERKRKKNG